MKFGYHFSTTIYSIIRLERLRGLTDSKVFNPVDLAHLGSQKHVPGLWGNGALSMVKNRRSWVITQVDLEYE